MAQSQRTNPAEELWEVCSRLAVQDNRDGETFLASQFNVEGWSAEFYEIIWCIKDRVNEVSNFADTLTMNGEMLDATRSALHQINTGFSRDTLRSSWTENGRRHFTTDHSGILIGISAKMQERYSYPKLTEEDAKDLMLDLLTLRDWLETHQLEEIDSIRQTIIEGLNRLIFRLGRLRWLGWGYSVDGFRDVVLASFMLEQLRTTDTSPNAEAMYLKLKGAIGDIVKKMGMFNDVVSFADIALRFYGMKYLISDVQFGGLLPGPT